jgi:hypothetical protein
MSHQHCSLHQQAVILTSGLEVQPLSAAQQIHYPDPLCVMCHPYKLVVPFGAGACDLEVCCVMWCGVYWSAEKIHLYQHTHPPVTTYSRNGPPALLPASASCRPHKLPSGPTPRSACCSTRQQQAAVMTGQRPAQSLGPTANCCCCCCCLGPSPT